MPQKEKYKSIAKNSHGRVCHDCKKPTNNYRCSQCWDKLREKNKINIEVNGIFDETYI